MTRPARRGTLLAAVQQTHAVRRLRRISQAGAPSLFRPTRTLTRYEHSIGVMRLARRLGLPVEHQVIALLHDTTHSAFSHTVDYLVANTAEDTHETHADRLLDDPALAGYLGVDLLAQVVHAITTKPQWLKLLDAVDYTLRDLRRAGQLDTPTTRRVLAGLTTCDGQVCFTDTETAGLFTRLMDQTHSQLYMDPPDLFCHWALAQLLAKALDHDVVTMRDIMTSDDTTILARIAHTPQLRGDLAAFRSLTPANLRERRDGQRITSKARLLDPAVAVTTSATAPLSELNPDWHATRQGTQQRASHGTALLTTT